MRGHRWKHTKTRPRDEAKLFECENCSRRVLWVPGIIRSPFGDPPPPPMLDGPCFVGELPSYMSIKNVELAT